MRVMKLIDCYSSGGASISILGYPLSSLTRLTTLRVLIFTICLKFQLNRHVIPFTVATEMWRASFLYFSSNELVEKVYYENRSF